jgi:hypothetical protein
MEAIRKKEYSAMLSLDISRAYDTCWRRVIILDTLRIWKINGKMFVTKIFFGFQIDFAIQLFDLDDLKKTDD